MPVFQLEEQIIFPHPSMAEKDGLLAVGGDLSVPRLLLAYENGIFPWYNHGSPILWWSPDPRMVLLPGRFRISKSLSGKIKSNKFTVTADKRFAEVIHMCGRVARKGQDGTWITSGMEQAYIELHQAGYAHSFEVLRENQLIGGLYGVSLGGMFFGESMFHTEPDASKIALYHLVKFALKNNFDMIDAQVTTQHLISLGAEEMNRHDYLKILRKSLRKTTLKGSWDKSSEM